MALKKFLQKYGAILMVCAVLLALVTAALGYHHIDARNKEQAAQEARNNKAMWALLSWQSTLNRLLSDQTYRPDGEVQHAYAEELREKSAALTEQMPTDGSYPAAATFLETVSYIADYYCSADTYREIPLEVVACAHCADATAYAIEFACYRAGIGKLTNNELFALLEKDNNVNLIADQYAEGRAQDIRLP